MINIIELLTFPQGKIYFTNINACRGNRCHYSLNFFLQCKRCQGGLNEICPLLLWNCEADIFTK